jgi:D-alanyl-D-alanine carboxypeptidase (penicillin-binding protein 5/6)
MLRLKKILPLLVAFIMLFSASSAAVSGVPAEEMPAGPSISAPSGILIEASTGEVLFEKNADEKLTPASVTKIMTLLLAFEALDAGVFKETDVLTCSDSASKMGGSQIYLSPGEQISVDDLLKGIAVASANDGAVLMAETIAGSEEGFVSMMNKRAQELGMNNTNFINSTGLDAKGHYTTARDIAIMSRELLRHEKIFKYTTIWLDELRGGQFMLSNTNKLIRFYEGANGLKTGYTSKAKHCLSASALRDGMQLISVVLAAPTSDDRFEDSKKLLNYGFANFKLITGDYYKEELPELDVLKGMEKTVPIALNPGDSIIILKNREKDIEVRTSIAKDLLAPVQKGQKVGEVEYYLGESKIGAFILSAQKDVPKITFGYTLSNLIRHLVMVGS